MDSTDPKAKVFVGQERCYQLMAGKMIEHAFNGYSACLFCYGQTGTGKTFTIMGNSQVKSEQGLLLRFMADMYQQVDELLVKQGCEIQCSLQIVEVYNEKVRDLLNDSSPQNPEVHVHPKLGVYLKHVLDLPANSLESCLTLIDEARGRQSFAATAMNAQSSRGHTVYKLSLEKHGGSDNTVLTSEVYFVDLAGRENERTTKVKGDRLVELSFINRSLMWLSQCIHALGGAAEPAKRRHSVGEADQPGPKEKRRPDKTDKKPKGDTKRNTDASRDRASAISEDSDATPHQRKAAGGKGVDMTRFRNSKLTLLLANALKGNSKTSVICTLSPARQHVDESLTTLNFATSLKHVKVEARAATFVDKDALISGLQTEVQALRDRLSSEGVAAVEELKSELEVANGMLQKYRDSWQEKIEENEKLREQRNSALRKLGVARFRMAARSPRSLSPKDGPGPQPNSRQSSKSPHYSPHLRQEDCPHLASYSDDPQINGRFIFAVAETGFEYCMGYKPDCDFILPRRAGIAPRSCIVWLDEGGLFIRPVCVDSVPVATVEINHVKLREEPKELRHGDFLVVGSSICFVVKSGTSPPGSNLHEKLPTWWGLGSQDRMRIMHQILPEPRREQLEVALQYMSALQGQNLDSRSFQRLDKFLISAKRAAALVVEANALTDVLKPLSKLNLELSSMAPVMVHGYGDNCGVPDLCVRLVRQTDKQEAELLSIWTMAQFEARLQIMREMHEKRLHRPDSFALDARLDPWADSGMPLRAQGTPECRPSAAPNTARETFSLHQDAERLVLKMDNLLAQNVSTQAHELKSEGQELSESKAPTAAHPPPPRKARSDDNMEQKMRQRATIAAPSPTGDSPRPKHRSRSLGLAELDSWEKGVQATDPLADASTTFSSSAGHLTADFGSGSPAFFAEADSISPGLAWEHQFGDTSPSFSSSPSGMYARAMERDRRLRAPQTCRMGPKPGLGFGVLSTASTPGEYSVPGNCTAPVPGPKSCPSSYGSLLTPRTDELWGWSSVPVSAPDLPELSMGQEASSPRNPFANPDAYVQPHNRWTLPARRRRPAVLTVQGPPVFPVAEGGSSGFTSAKYSGSQVSQVVETSAGLLMG
ncbi:unc-104 [Symbiodinium sp. CCMP2592]|nr:unc-104 [Symbiodinium sp. CCMP2592]